MGGLSNRAAGLLGFALGCSALRGVAFRRKTFQRRWSSDQLGDPSQRRSPAFVRIDAYGGRGTHVAEARATVIGDMPYHNPCHAVEQPDLLEHQVGDGVIVIP